MSNHRDHKQIHAYQPYTQTNQQINTSGSASVDRIAQEGVVSLRAVQDFSQIAQDFPQVGIKTSQRKHSAAERPNYNGQGRQGQKYTQEDLLLGTKFRHWLASRSGGGMKVSATRQTSIVSFTSRAGAHVTSAQQSSDRSPTQKDFEQKKQKPQGQGTPTANPANGLWT
jgi:hypothetical protein